MLNINVVLMEPAMYFCGRVPKTSQNISIKKVKPVLKKIKIKKNK